MSYFSSAQLVILILKLNYKHVIPPGQSCTQIQPALRSLGLVYDLLGLLVVYSSSLQLSRLSFPSKKNIHRDIKREGYVLDQPPWFLSFLYFPNLCLFGCNMACLQLLIQALCLASALWSRNVGQNSESFSLPSFFYSLLLQTSFRPSLLCS